MRPLVEKYVEMYERERATRIEMESDRNKTLSKLIEANLEIKRLRAANDQLRRLLEQEIGT